MSRGSSTIATSEPPAKTHPAAAPAELLAHEVGADRPEVLGTGHRKEGDPPPPDRPALRARSRAEAIIRVAAIGDMALTVTPGGASRPSCQVRAATARLAQL